MSDPDAAATGDSGTFGLPFPREQSRIVLPPIPSDAGCAQPGPMREERALPPAASPAVPRPGTPSNVEPPAPAVNLSGFPLPYRQGYADGCASATGAERKEVARYGSDGNYRTGWQDGRALCRKK